MPGNSPLDPRRLLDGLVPTVDKIRQSLHTSFGVRPFKCFTVRRTWSGSMQGEGSYTDVVKELTPSPKVWLWDGYKWVLTSTGTTDNGNVRLTEVSLTYTYKDLTGGVDDDTSNVQFFYRLTDALNTGMPTRTLRLLKPPFPDREKHIGWDIVLTNMNVPQT